MMARPNSSGTNRRTSEPWYAASAELSVSSNHEQTGSPTGFDGIPEVRHGGVEGTGGIYTGSRSQGLKEAYTQGRATRRLRRTSGVFSSGVGVRTRMPVQTAYIRLSSQRPSNARITFSIVYSPSPSNMIVNRLWPTRTCSPGALEAMGRRTFPPHAYMHVQPNGSMRIL